LPFRDSLHSGNLISYDWTLFALIAEVLAIKQRFRDTKFLPALSLLSPFFLYINEYQENHPTRIRYGLPFVPVAIFFLAYWPGKSRLITFLFLVWTANIWLVSPFYKSGASELLMESMRDLDNLSIQRAFKLASLR
jgi:hypothetical protein